MPLVWQNGPKTLAKHISYFKQWTGRTVSPISTIAGWPTTHALSKAALVCLALHPLHPLHRLHPASGIHWKALHSWHALHISSSGIPSTPITIAHAAAAGSAVSSDAALTFRGEHRAHLWRCHGHGKRGARVVTRNLRRSWNQPKWQQFPKAMKPWSWTTTKRCTALSSNQCEFSGCRTRQLSNSKPLEGTEPGGRPILACIHRSTGRHVANLTQKSSWSGICWFFSCVNNSRSCKVGWSWLDSLTQPTAAKRSTPPKFEHSHSSYLKNDDYQIWKSLFQGSAFQEAQN